MHASSQATAGLTPQPFPPSLGVFPGLAAVARLPQPAVFKPAAPARKIAPLTGALSPAQEAMLLEHLPLVRMVARALAERLPAHVEMDELISAGMLGLLDAARRFEAGRGVQFRSYARFRIRGAILDSLRAMDWSPRELRRQGRVLAQARRTLEGRLGRPADEAELAEEMGLPLEELQQLTGSLRSLEVTPLNVERGEDFDEEELAFVPANENENPLSQYLEGESRKHLLEAIEALPERERLVMRLYYFEEMTMREIGQVLGVVESRISQIHHETLRRLRMSLARLRRPATRRAPARRAA